MWQHTCSLESPEFCCEYSKQTGSLHPDCQDHTGDKDDDSPFITSPYDDRHNDDSHLTTSPYDDRHDDDSPFTTSRLTRILFLSQIPFLHYLMTYDDLFPLPHDVFPYQCNEKVAPPKACSRISRIATCLTQAPSWLMWPQLTPVVPKLKTGHHRTTCINR